MENMGLSCKYRLFPVGAVNKLLIENVKLSSICKNPIHTQQQASNYLVYHYTLGVNDIFEE